MMAIDLSKQQALDVDPKAMQKTNFTGNIDQAENTSIFFIIEEAKETVLNSSEGTVKILQFYFVLIKYQHKITKYAKFSNSKLNKLKSRIKNGTQVTLNLSTNMVGDSNNSNGETNFLYKLLLTDTQVSRICKTFANGSSASKKLNCLKWYSQGDFQANLFDR